MKARLLILILVFFSYFYGNALAYLENYPPYKFEDGPPDHLEAESLIDSDKKGYESKDSKVSVRLKETTDGLDFLVKEGENVLVHIKSKDTSMPYAIYRVDLDGNGLKDFIIFYNYRDWLTGIKEDKVEIFLKRNEGSYQKLSYDAITVGLEDFVDLDKDGKYEIIITDMYSIKKHTYLTYNIYEFKDYRFLNANAKFEGFPKFVWHTFNANDKDATNLTEEERLVHISKKDNSIQYQEIVSELKVSSVQTPTELDKEPVSLGSVSEEKLFIKIGVVDIQRAIEESKKGKEAKQYLEGLLSLRSKEELEKTEQELIRQVVKDIGIIVEEYAKKEKFTHIIDRLEGKIIYIEKRFDLTDKIIELYDKRVGK